MPGRTYSQWFCGPEPQLRPGQPGDLHNIMSVDSSVSLNPWSEQSLVPYLRPSPAESHHALVLEVDGELAGFLIFSRVLDEASIDNVAVSPSLQGRGLGAALLQGALRKMSRLGQQRCLLEVRESNVAARALYEKNGFVVDGIRSRYYKTEHGREDALLMSRRL